MEEFDLYNNLFNALLAIIQAIILAGFTVLFTKKAFKAVNNNNSLKKIGINEIYDGGKIKRQQMIKILSKATEIKMCYVSGENLFNQYFDIIKEIIKSKNPSLELKILLCKEDTDFVKEIEKIEKKYGFRKEDDIKIDKSIRNVYNKFCSLHSQNINIRITNTFYFFPYFIARFKSEKGDYKEAYMNYYIPPRKAKDSIFIKARVNSDEEDNYYYQLNGKNFLKDKTKNIVVDLEAHFDYIWNNQVPPNEKTLLTMFEIML